MGTLPKGTLPRFVIRQEDKNAEVLSSLRFGSSRKKVEMKKKKKSAGRRAPAPWGKRSVSAPA
jgi:hypothetical protein